MNFLPVLHSSHVQNAVFYLNEKGNILDEFPMEIEELKTAEEIESHHFNFLINKPSKHRTSTTTFKATRQTFNFVLAANTITCSRKYIFC